MKIPFIGPTYENKSVPVAAQRCINFYPEIETQDSRNVIVLQGCSGVKAFSSWNDSIIRATHWNEKNSKLFIVSASALYEIDVDGNETSLGSIAGGDIEMADNGDHLVIVNGSTYYVWDISTSVLSTVANGANASDVTFQDGYILFAKSGTDQFGWSDVDDAKTINALSFLSSNASPDLIVGIAQVERRIWVFGTDSITIWYNSGAATPWTLVDGGSSNGFGLAGPKAKVVKNSRVYWCSNDGKIYVSNGYIPQPISNYSIENSLRKMSTLEDCRAEQWTENGHEFIGFTFPSGRETWVFDVTTGMWHQRSSGTSGDIWDGIGVVRAFGKNLVGDIRNSRIGELDVNTYQEYGSEFVARRVSPVIQAGQNVLTHSRLELFFEFGTVTTQDFDPQISLRWSDDGGETWGNWVTRGLGKIGNYRTRATWYRLGQTQNRVYDMRISDNAPRVLIDAVLEGEVGEL